MKTMKHHQATLSKFSEIPFFIKMAIKFLIPVSIFSIIVSYSSLISLALHFIKFSFSAYSIDKNYMFLLFNGILVFIFKNSGVINKSPEETDHITAQIVIKQRGNEQQQQVVKLSDEKVHMEIEEGQETEPCSCVMEASENSLSVAKDDQANECTIVYEEEAAAVAAEAEGEEEEGKGEEEEEGTGLLSTEELNKKCDDFIRKMKEVIKFEAQQLILV